MVAGPAPGMGGVPVPPADLSRVGHSIEDQIRLHYFSPAPNTYNPQLPPKKVQLDNGLIKDGKHPSFSDIGGKDIPGPGKYSAFVYEPGDMPMPGGGRVYLKDRNKVMQSKGLVGPKLAARMLREYAGAKYPDPGTYFPDVTSVRPRLTKLTKFGKQPKFPRPLRSSNEGPGVGKYDVQGAQEALDPFVPEGGKNWLNQHKPQYGYFDEATFVTMGNPGPGAYEQDKPKKQRDYSQEVYHHTTETMAESKALVKMHTSTDVPGPGQYSLPELPSLAQAPKITGRALPFAVPKPFAYNAQPDMGRKFQPLRASNSGDLIFGRNFKSGQEMLANYPAHHSAEKETGAAPAGGFSQRQMAEMERKKQLQLQNEQIAVDEQRIARKDKELSEKPGQSKWVEGGYEVFDLEPVFDSNGQPIAKKAKQQEEEPPPRSPKRDLLGAKASVLQEEHPAVLRAAQSYQRMGGKLYKPTKAFLPQAAKRPVAIDANDDSNISMNFDVGKKEYVGVANALAGATEDLIQQMKAELPMGHLLHQSENALRDKALRKMNLDGIPPAVSSKVLAEMPRLFEKPTETRARLAAEVAALEDMEQQTRRAAEEAALIADEDSESRPGSRAAAAHPVEVDTLAGTNAQESSVREGDHEQLGQTSMLTSSMPLQTSENFASTSLDPGAAGAGPTENVDIFPIDGQPSRDTLGDNTVSTLVGPGVGVGSLEGPSTIIGGGEQEREQQQAEDAAETAASAGAEGTHEGEEDEGGAAPAEDDHGAGQNHDPSAVPTDGPTAEAEGPDSRTSLHQDAEEGPHGSPQAGAGETEGDHASQLGEPPERPDTAQTDSPAGDAVASGGAAAQGGEPDGSGGAEVEDGGVEAAAAGHENAPMAADEPSGATGTAPDEEEAAAPPEPAPAEESDAAGRPADIDPGEAAAGGVTAEPSPGNTSLDLAEEQRDEVGPLPSEIVALAQAQAAAEAAIDAEAGDPAPGDAPLTEAEHAATLAPLTTADGDDFEVD